MLAFCLPSSVSPTFPLTSSQFIPKSRLYGPSLPFFIAKVNFGVRPLLHQSFDILHWMNGRHLVQTGCLRIINLQAANSTTQCQPPKVAGVGFFSESEEIDPIRLSSDRWKHAPARYSWGHIGINNSCSAIPTRISERFGLLEPVLHWDCF